MNSCRFIRTIHNDEIVLCIYSARSVHLPEAKKLLYLLHASLSLKQQFSDDFHDIFVTICFMSLKLPTHPGKHLISPRFSFLPPPNPSPPPSKRLKSTSLSFPLGIESIPSRSSFNKKHIETHRDGILSQTIIISKAFNRYLIKASPQNPIK
jgi:hypothetical protein